MADLMTDLKAAVAERAKVSGGPWNTGPETGAGHVWIYRDGAPMAEPTHWLRRAFKTRTDHEPEWVPGETSDARMDRFWQAKQDTASAIVACGNAIGDHGPALLALVELAYCAKAWAALRMEYKALEKSVVDRFADAGRPRGVDAWDDDDKKRHNELLLKMLSALNGLEAACGLAEVLNG